MTTAEHFLGCHPEHERAEDDEQPAEQRQPVEPCWHCGTPTPHGCDCSECWENAHYVPPGACYHCPTCGRWWAYMTLNVTTITFPGRDEA